MSLLTPKQPCHRDLLERKATVSKSEISAILGVSVRTIERWTRAGEFPKPRRAGCADPTTIGKRGGKGGGRTLWRAKDVQSWIDAE